MVEELIARIKAEGWRMNLEYLPFLDIFVCELSAQGKRAFAESKAAESAIIDAIRRMDEWEY